MNWYHIKKINGAATYRDIVIVSETIPQTPIEWDETWSQVEWDAYEATVQFEAITIYNANTLAQFVELMSGCAERCDYKSFRTKLWDFVVISGGFYAQTEEHKIFIALNRLGTKSERAAVLVDEEQQILNYLQINNLT